MDDKEKGNLAIGKAHEPQEDACQPSTQNMPPSQNKEIKQSIASTDNEMPDSQTSNTRGAVLGRRAPETSHLRRLLRLQNERTKGLWAQCDECDRWRYLPHVLDRHELPKKWFCRMNPAASPAGCSEAEAALRLREEEQLIHASYAPGSLVLCAARGWARWPAMVDDCPDTEQFYWLDGFSDIPTHYNVVFFDRCEVTRAWVKPARLEPYSKCKSMFKASLRSGTYRSRLEVAVSQADDAETLPLVDRLKKYSFISRYRGPILDPKRVTERYHQKYRRRFKRKYDIDLPSEMSDSECEVSDDNIEINARNRNVIKLGSKKSKLNEENYTINKPNCFVDESSSSVAQMDTQSASVTEDTSSNFPDSTILDTQEIENRTRSPASDDFDF